MKDFLKKIKWLFLLSALFFNFAPFVSATVISFETDTISTKIGEKFQIGLQIDLGEETIKSAGIDLEFDADIIKFEEFQFDSGFSNRAPALDRVDVQSQNLVSIVFGGLNEIGGTFEIGKLTLSSINLGVSDISLDKSLKWGGFGEITPEFINSSVQVVPIPASVWLFSTASLGLIGFGRKITL